MEKVGELAAGKEMTVAIVELLLGGSAVCNDLIEISVVLHRLVQPHRLVLVVLLHSPVIPAIGD